MKIIKIALCYMNGYMTSDNAYSAFGINCFRCLKKLIMGRNSSIPCNMGWLYLGQTLGNY